MNCNITPPTMVQLLMQSPPYPIPYAYNPSVQPECWIYLKTPSAVATVTHL